MSGNMKEILDTLEAVTKTANEVRELLQKSMPPPPPAMNKADDQDADDQGGGMPPPAAAPEGGMPPSDAPPPAAAAPEGGDMPPPEGGEGGEDAFGAELASMNDEELTMLLQALAEEMEKRKGAQSPEGGIPPEGAGAPPPAPSPEMDAMKSENVSMKKSIQGMQNEIAELKKSLSKPAPTTRPASMNKPQVQNKTEAKVEHLTKSEVLSHLESLKKSGNRSVDTDLIWKANSARSVEDIAAVYHDAKIKGIEIPNKK